MNLRSMCFTMLIACLIQLASYVDFICHNGVDVLYVFSFDMFSFSETTFDSDLGDSMLCSPRVIGGVASGCTFGTIIIILIAYLLNKKLRHGGEFTNRRIKIILYEYIYQENQLSTIINYVR